MAIKPFGQITVLPPKYIAFSTEKLGLMSLNTPVVFSSTGHLPAPLSEDRLYFALPCASTNKTNNIRISLQNQPTTDYIKLENEGEGDHEIAAAISFAAYTSSSNVRNNSFFNVLTSNGLNHPFREHETVSLFTSGKLPSPLQENEVYCLCNVTDESFQLTSHTGGEPIELEDKGSGVHFFRFSYVKMDTLKKVQKDRFQAVVSVSSFIYPSHFTDLQTRINAELVRRGRLQYSFSTPTTNSPILATHINELRAAVNQIAPEYAGTGYAVTDPSIVAGCIIMAAHLNELDSFLYTREHENKVAATDYYYYALSNSCGYVWTSPVRLAWQNQIGISVYGGGGGGGGGSGGGGGGGGGSGDYTFAKTSGSGGGGGGTGGYGGGAGGQGSSKYQAFSSSASEPWCVVLGGGGGGGSGGCGGACGTANTASYSCNGYGGAYGSCGGGGSGGGTTTVYSVWNSSKAVAAGGGGGGSCSGVGDYGRGGIAGYASGYCAYPRGSSYAGTPGCYNCPIYVASGGAGARGGAGWGGGGGGGGSGGCCFCVIFGGTGGMGYYGNGGVTGWWLGSVYFGPAASGGSGGGGFSGSGAAGTYCCGGTAPGVGGGGGYGNSTGAGGCGAPVTGAYNGYADAGGGGGGSGYGYISAGGTGSYVTSFAGYLIGRGGDGGYGGGGGGGGRGASSFYTGSSFNYTAYESSGGPGGGGASGGSGCYGGAIISYYIWQ